MHMYKIDIAHKGMMFELGPVDLLKKLAFPNSARPFSLYKGQIGKDRVKP
jgi:hypothetical protein